MTRDKLHVLAEEMVAERTRAFDASFIHNGAIGDYRAEYDGYRAEYERGRFEATRDFLEKLLDIMATEPGAEGEIAINREDIVHGYRYQP